MKFNPAHHNLSTKPSRGRNVAEAGERGGMGGPGQSWDQGPIPCLCSQSQLMTQAKAPTGHLELCSQQAICYPLSNTKDLFNRPAQQTKILWDNTCSSLIKLNHAFFFLIPPFFFLVGHHSNYYFSNFQVSESWTMLSSCVCNSRRSKVQLVYCGHQNREKDDQENERGERKQAFSDRKKSLALADTTRQEEANAIWKIMAWPQERCVCMCVWNKH